jgi:hypothetical protein
MTRELWKFSIPNQAARSYHEFVKTDDSCSIVFDFERYPEVLPLPPDSILRLTLSFQGVVEYKSLSEHEQDAEMIRVAGHKLVDMGESLWLTQARLKLDPTTAAHLRHLMVDFVEDGICYQFLCSSYSISEAPSPVKGIPW